ncbi:MAG: hypothetical protein AAF939_00945 [Planctomycetota bacterium]
MNFNQLLKQISSTRFRAFALAVVVVAIVTLLQVQQLKRNLPMCQILGNQGFEVAELQEIEIALSKSDLTQYRIENGHLKVPVSQKAKYLKAIADADALPGEHEMSEQSDRAAFNPFLSRTQQIAIQKIEKKQQIKEMVSRLPFVRQAWFEMDQVESNSAFQAPQQSAVISIRPLDQQALSDQNVHTVKRMISGAVAGLHVEDIVVIDLSIGFAHHDHNDPNLVQQQRIQQLTKGYQKSYRDAILTATRKFEGIDVEVTVEVIPIEEPIESVQDPFHSTVQQATATTKATFYSAGANGVASIQDFPSPPATQISSQSSNTGFQRPLSHTKRVSVEVNVPEPLLFQVYGPAKNPGKSGKALTTKELERDRVEKFDLIKVELSRLIQPLISDSSYLSQSKNPIRFELIPEVKNTNSAWVTNTQLILVRQWPSIAVLGIGLILIALMTRTDQATDYSSTASDLPVSLGIHRPESTTESDSSDFRISKMIEKDPDAAAKVIESWIRDAA